MCSSKFNWASYSTFRLTVQAVIDRSQRRSIQDAFHGGDRMSSNHVFPEHDPNTLSPTAYPARSLPKQNLEAMLRE